VQLEHEMTNIRQLAHGHLTGVVVVSASPKSGAGPDVPNDLPVFFLAWRAAACSSQPYIHLPDAIEALLVLERSASGAGTGNLSGQQAELHSQGTAPESLLALWDTIRPVGWSALDRDSQASAATQVLLTRATRDLGRAIMFTDEDLTLLGEKGLLPETVEVTARDVAFTLVEAIEATATAKPTREPYSI
jgi:hypothetical protein